MGQTPALMGGLFLNTTMFVKTSDAAGYSKMVKEALGAINGKTTQGLTYTTGYEAGKVKVGDKSVDEWSMKFQMDQNNPAAATGRPDADDALRPRRHGRVHGPDRVGRGDRPTPRTQISWAGRWRPPSPAAA